MHGRAHAHAHLSSPSPPLRPSKPRYCYRAPAARAPPIDGAPQGESRAMRAMRSELISSALAVAASWRTDEVGGGAAAAEAISGSFIPCFAAGRTDANALTSY